MDITIENAYSVLKKYLGNSDKFEHSIRVAQTSKLLAKKWNAPINDSVIAGLLHDIGKSINKNEMLKLCIKHNLTIYDFEIYCTLSALHGKVGSILFEQEFNKKDIYKFNSISNAIKNHVAGNSVMNILDKIIFIADNVEPARPNDFLLHIQSGEINDCNECIKIIIDDKLKRAKQKNREINPLLIETLDSVFDR